MKNIKSIIPRTGYVIFWLILSLFYAIIFVTIEFSDSPISGVRGFLVIMSQWLVVSMFATPLLGLMSLNRWFFSVVFPVFMVLSTVMAYYTLTMGVHLTGSIIEVMMVNDSKTWASVISWRLVAWALLSLVASVFVIIYRLFKVSGPSMPIIWVLGFITLILTPKFVIKRLDAPVSGRVPYSFWASAMEYVANYHDIDNDHRTTFDSEIVCRDSVSPLIVFVIGESLRPDHLQLNGYKRNTTPLLSSEPSVVSLPNVTSREIFTHLSVPYIMTRADKDNDDRRWNEQSFITLFKRAGYHTTWLSNQDRCPNYAYFMNESDTLINVSPHNSLYSYGKWLDSDILPHLESILSNREKPQLIVIHSIGSHWWYPSHYAESSAMFKPEVDSRILSELTHEQIVNSYDNTIIETDKFLHSVIDKIRGMNAIMIFVSDHGESMGEGGEYLHKGDMPQLHPTASIIWYSDEYARRWPDKINALRHNRTKKFDTDVYFHTTLDAASLHTEVMDSTKSILR